MGATNMLNTLRGAGRYWRLVVWAVLVVTPSVAAEDGQPPNDSWRNLPLVSGGTIDPHWQHLWGGGFSVTEDGSLRTDCTDEGMGLLLYTKERFGDCQIRVVYRSQDAKSNAGVFVRIGEGVLARANDPLPPRERDQNGKLTRETLKRIEDSSNAEREAWYPVHHGYEVQICGTGDEYHRTGAIYSLARAATPPEKSPGEWKTMIVTLEGNRILVDVDGKRLTAFDPDGPGIPARRHWSEPRREPERPRSGFIGLQNHDPGDVVYFKEVSVRPLGGAESGSDRAATGPFDGKAFRGRIAYGADGNFNDPDDWAASPVALAVFAEAGLKDRLVHFHYNDIMPRNNPEWRKTHAECVLGAAKHYGYDTSNFHDCQEDLDRAVASIARAINESSADNPLYFIVAGPMEVPFRGIQKSDPQKRKHVYCISHSRWNDGFSSAARHDFFTYTKRSVIESGIHWVQIQDQNRLLSHSRYGRPAQPDEFRPYIWMRDSKDPKVTFLWERVVISTRPDPSDAGMAWFLVTGDEECDPQKLQRLLEEGKAPTPVAARSRVRIEAENFQVLEGFKLEDRNDRNASHRLNVARTGDKPDGRIRTRFDQPYVALKGRYDVEVRYLAEPGKPSRFTVLRNGSPVAEPLVPQSDGQGWKSFTLEGVEIRTGDEIAVEINGSARLDYVQLARSGAGASEHGSKPAEPEAKRFVATGELDDPAALPGQIIVKGSRPGYLKYNGGGVAFLCGPDNPEDFLFLGDLNPDGTRSNGPQQQIIDRMADAGVSVCHVLAFRMRRCNIKDEGDDRHCPFVDFDPANPLNEKVLDQWEGWLKQLEKHGIAVHLEFYNDATDVERMGWTLDGQGGLHKDEERFVAGIVNRFEHLKNIVWGIEESVNKLPRARTPHFMKLSALIAREDDHHHPIVHSFVTPDTSERDIHPDGVMGKDYAGDPHVQIVTWLHALPHGEDYEAQHRHYLKYAGTDNDRFIVMKSETERFPRNLTQSRRYLWSCAMTGMHTPESGLNALTRPRLLDDAGRVATFMERTDFHTMRPRDELAAGSTNWVLANPGRSYIAYSYNYSGPMGVKDLPAGEYELIWFDTISGRSETRSGIQIEAGEATWSKPGSFGIEIALFVKRRGAAE
jgi:hypothetical protein